MLRYNLSKGFWIKKRYLLGTISDLFLNLLVPTFDSLRFYLISDKWYQIANKLFVRSNRTSVYYEHIESPPTHREVYFESYGIFHSDTRNKKREIMNSVGFVGPPPMHPHELHQILSVMRIFNFEITITTVSENHRFCKYCDIWFLPMKIQHCKRRNYHDDSALNHVIFENLIDALG